MRAEAALAVGVEPAAVRGDGMRLVEKEDAARDDEVEVAVAGVVIVEVLIKVYGNADVTVGVRAWVRRFDPTKVLGVIECRPAIL